MPGEEHDSALIGAAQLDGCVQVCYMRCNTTLGSLSPQPFLLPPTLSAPRFRVYNSRWIYDTAHMCLLDLDVDDAIPYKRKTARTTEHGDGISMPEVPLFLNLQVRLPSILSLPTRSNRLVAVCYPGSVTGATLFGK